MLEKSKGLITVGHASNTCKNSLAGQQGRYPTATPAALCQTVYTLCRGKVKLSQWACSPPPLLFTQTMYACQLPVFSSSHTEWSQSLPVGLRGISRGMWTAGSGDRLFKQICSIEPEDFCHRWDEHVGAVGKCNIYIPLEACMVWEVGSGEHDKSIFFFFFFYRNKAEFIKVVQVKCHLLRLKPAEGFESARSPVVGNLKPSGPSSLY